MAAVNEWIVKEYFEQLGFLVSQPCKHSSNVRRRRVEEDLDLLVSQPGVAAQRVPEHMVWTAEDLKSVSCAVVGIYGGHTERFYAATLASNPDIVRFAGRAAREEAARRLNSAEVAVILCLPDLPASEELKTKALTALRERGVDGVLTFPTLLMGLIEAARVNRDYLKSDLLQVLRILKNYGLIRDPQMELFGKRRHRTAGKGDA